MFSRRSMSRRALVVVAISGLVIAGAAGSASATGAGQPSGQHVSINCEYSTLCPDLVDSAQVFGTERYVGHDEPSLGFYSNKPGAGNRMQYSVTLPNDPTPSHPTQPGKG